MDIFYEAVAEKLLHYQTDRRPLIDGIHKIASRVGGLAYLQDKFADGSTGPLKDICPFTAMGTFNRAMTDANRKAIAAEIVKSCLASTPRFRTFFPKAFRSSTLRGPGFSDMRRKRGAGDIDALWNVFAAATRFVEFDQPEDRAEFAKAYDVATEVWGVAWNLDRSLLGASLGISSR